MMLSLLPQSFTKCPPGQNNPHKNIKNDENVLTAKEKLMILSVWLTQRLIIYSSGKCSLLSLSHPRCVFDAGCGAPR